jgi:hypothetical protein
MINKNKNKNITKIIIIIIINKKTLKNLLEKYLKMWKNRI